MARVKVDPECPHIVRRVRRLIENRMGGDAATVFGEAMANVREHGKSCHAELILHTTGFEVRNAQHGRFRSRSRKAAGEGGYGRRLMEQCGGSMNTAGRECYVQWKRPAIRSLDE